MICLPIIQSLNQADEAKEKAEPALLQTVDNLKIRTEQLEVSNKELESFSYSVSHDLRAPPRAVNGYAQVLLNDYGDILDKDAKKIIHTISYNGKKMGNLVDTLLQFAKIGKTGISKKQIDMFWLANSVVEELRALLKDKPAITIEPIPPAYGDEALVTQVLENLISNAIKYSGKNPNPQIKIGTVNLDAGVAYYVQDNGDGFDMRHYNKLFMVFHRLHGQEEFEGTGIGLAIAQKIILLHKGAIWAEGKKGEGATFYFTLSHHQ